MKPSGQIDQFHICPLAVVSSGPPTFGCCTAKGHSQTNKADMSNIPTKRNDHTGLKLRTAPIPTCGLINAAIGATQIGKKYAKSNNPSNCPIKTPQRTGGERNTKPRRIGERPSRELIYPIDNKLTACTTMADAYGPSKDKGDKTTNSYGKLKTPT